MFRVLSCITVCCSLLACTGLAAQDDREERLRVLGEACLRYADAHGGRLPANLKELYYQGYINDLALFSLPGSGPTVLNRERLDEQSGYALTRGAAAAGGAMPLLAERPTAGTGEVPCFFTDRSIRRVPAETVPLPTASADMPPATQPVLPPAPVAPATGAFTPLERWGAGRIEVEAGTPFSEQLLQALAGAEGVAIKTVAAGTVADQLGLRVDDLLVGVAGQPISSQRDLANALASVADNTPVPLAVVRAGALRIFTVDSRSLPQTAREALARAATQDKPGATAPLPPVANAGQPDPAAIPWPDVALWRRAVDGLRSQAMVYDSKETGDANFRERLDKAHLPDGSLAEFRYWLADGKWRMSRALFKPDAGRQDWLLAEFNDDGVLWAVHHGQDEGGNWRASLHDNDLDGRPEAFSVDVDGDGKTDAFGTDTNGDGRVDRVTPPPTDQPQSEDLPVLNP